MVLFAQRWRAICNALYTIPNMGNAVCSKGVLLVCQHVMLVNDRHSRQLSSCVILSQVKKGNGQQASILLPRIILKQRNLLCITMVCRKSPEACAQLL